MKMLRLAIFIFCWIACSANVVPIKYRRTWGTDQYRTMLGKCTVTMPNYQPKGDLSLMIQLDRETYNIKIRGVDVISKELNGKIYNLESRRNFNVSKTFRFQLKYRGTEAEHPNGYCISAFNGDSIDTDNLPIDMPVTTVPLIENASWRAGSQYMYEGNCSIPICEDLARYEVVVKFDKPTSAFTEWNVEILDQEDSGMWYRVRGKQSASRPNLNFKFHVTYNAQPPPTGSCTTILPSECNTVTVSSTSSSRAPTTTTTTAKTTTEAQTTTSASQTTTSSSSIRSSAISRPLHVSSHWPEGNAYKMEGHCIIPISQTLPEYKVLIELNKKTSGFTDWNVHILQQDTVNGMWYYVKPRHSVSPPELRFHFHVVYSSEPHPEGTCTLTNQLGSTRSTPVSTTSTTTPQPTTPPPPTTATPQPTTSTTTPQPTTSTTAPQPTTTAQPTTSTITPQPTTTHQPTTSTTTPQPTTSTTTPKPTTTPQPTTSTTTPQPSTSSSAPTSVTTPLYVSSSWPEGSAYKMEGHCTIPISQPLSEYEVFINLNKETSDFTEWQVELIDEDIDGIWYDVKGRQGASPPEISFNFHVKYYSEPHPEGTCTLTTQSGSTPSPYPTVSTAATTKTTAGVSSTTTTTQNPTGPTAPTTTQPPSSSNYNYSEVLHKSILFYEAQRSGHLPASNRIPYRGDSSLDDTTGSVPGDLAGGWHDAGDHVKFNFPMASSTTLLSLGLYLFKDGYADAGELNNMYNSIKWPLDYFLKCWKEDSNNLDNSRYYAQVGDPGADHSFWGRPEDMTMNRPSYYVDRNNPGSDVVAETAAAMTAGALAFDSKDATYATTLLQNAKKLYTFAESHPGKYSDNIPAQGFYSSSGYRDELCISSALLYMATDDQIYLNNAKSYYESNTAWALSWDDKKVLCQVLLLGITEDPVYESPVKAFLNDYMNGGVHKTPCGLAYRDQWGSLRYSANAAYLALLAADSGSFSNSLKTSYIKWAMSQIHYMLGDNNYDRSYVVGFGHNPPQRPHHRAASCPDKPAPCGNNEFTTPNPNPQVLYGALVGGPDGNDYYFDDRTDYIKNEVATDYNAGFQSAVAALQCLKKSGQLPVPDDPLC